MDDRRVDQVHRFARGFLSAVASSKQASGMWHDWTGRAFSSAQAGQALVATTIVLVFLHVISEAEWLRQHREVTRMDDQTQTTVRCLAKLRSVFGAVTETAWAIGCSVVAAALG